MRSLIYYVATSLDGFIAHADGSFDGFPWSDEVVERFMASLGQFDTVLMGRLTYEVGLQAGQTSPYPMMKQVVFSRTMEASPDSAVTLISDHVPSFVRDLKTQSGQAIWLCGGGQLASDLFAEGLIDQLIVKLNPVLFGSGIPLFTDQIDVTQLSLVNQHTCDNGTLFLTYDITAAQSAIANGAVAEEGVDALK